MTFRLGTRQIRSVDLIGQDQVARLKKKFSAIDPQEFEVALRELLRFLYLSAHCPSQMFFPGNKLIDDLWHALITETESYQTLCNRLRPGIFLHHSGVPFAEYISKLPSEKVHEEQMSWLASYHHSFGRIEADAFRMLYLAESLAERLGCDLAGLNAFAAQLVARALENGDTTFEYDDFLARVRGAASTIDRDPEVLNRFLRELVMECSKEGSSLNPFQNQHMEKLFGASTALAFTLWQHLAACERLSEYSEWQAENDSVWQNLISGRSLCGLATTHLARPSGPSIKGELKGEQLVISGQADWVCGWGLFDHLLVGFELGEEICFAVTSFPGVSEETGNRAVIVPQAMACLGGSGTVSIEFRNYPISIQSLVSRRSKNNAPMPRPSRFLVPEIGIAKYAVTEIERQGAVTTHPRKKMVLESLDNVKERIQALEELKKRGSLDELMYLRDEINRDAVRLLAINEGAHSIHPESHVPRLQLELLLLDSVAQPPSCFARKVKAAASGQHVEPS